MFEILDLMKLEIEVNLRASKTMKKYKDFLSEAIDSLM